MSFSKIKLSLSFAIVLLSLAACGGGEKSKTTKSAALTSEADSLAYIMGVSVAQNLIKMDTSINLAVVAKAIAQYGEGKALMNDEDARMAYLRYIVHVEPERRRGYEDRYLAELAELDRTFTRTASGLTYRVVKIGNEKLMPRNVGDWVEFSYSVSRIGGEKIIDNKEVKSGYANFPKGLLEALKLIGAGGEIKAWMPSKLAYGDDGDEQLKVEPFETLLYEIKLSKMERNGTSNHKPAQRVNF